MIWVLDASVAVRWFIKEEVHPHADEVLDKLIDEPERLEICRPNRWSIIEQN